MKHHCQLIRSSGACMMRSFQVPPTLRNPDAPASYARDQLKSRQMILVNVRGFAAQKDMVRSIDCDDERGAWGASPSLREIARLSSFV